MTAISRFVNGGRPLLLAHVFVTARTQEAIEFEVLEVNALSLRRFIGEKNSDLRR
jgi:hypothetical protein